MNSQDDILFSIQYLIQKDDINHGGHLDFSQLVRIIGEARISFFQSKKINDIDLNSNIGIITKTLHVDYLKEAFFQEELTISIFPKYIKNASFRLGFNVSVNLTNTNIASAEITFAAIDYISKKISRIPRCFLNILNYRDTPIF